MQKPTLHLNGTSKNALVEAYEEAGRQLRVALNALAESGPNARDYYPQGPEAFGLAVAEHCSRVDRVRSVLNEIEELHFQMET